MPKPQNSIDIIGLQSHIDKSKHDHNDQGYSEFKLYMKSNVPISAMARLFKVDFKTMKKWRNLYKVEANK